ncbi:DNA-binding transcriptional LysR family regulator [Maribacter vaceletii]|uniref:DNA-binding transcriptional LysR family regulator n=1 Tax=Maribacter vaceletii TaxID=1206816 RepID=A0A495EBQ7_9FLAO|nr:LysR substrate-binding domain-containing protein [Maribacter vaceletii]RKR14290.1 DNA-binding transcriptional LysR family regulator [Maribacter vaceletii]
MISITNQIELRQLRYFIVLAEILHFRKAAEGLSISQSALSQQILLLESIVGTKLFERNNRNVSLSTSGELFLMEAKKIIKQVDSSVQNWILQNEGKKGALKIGFVASAMQQYLPPILKSFDEEHPKIKLQLEELTNIDQLKHLEENTIDIGFMRSNMVNSSILLKPIFKEHFTLVLPQEHAITKANFKNIGQLSEAPFILFPNENSPLYYQQILNLCANHGFSPKITHKSIHAPTIFRLVENGMGISIIPNSLRDNFNYKVRFIELKNIPQKTELYAAWNKNNDNPALKYLLNLI